MAALSFLSGIARATISSQGRVLMSALAFRFQQNLRSGCGPHVVLLPFLSRSMLELTA